MSWNTIYLVDAAAISLFAVSYYRNCYRKGYRADFWHLTLFLNCIFPYLVMLLFTNNVLNAVIVGKDFEGVVSVAPSVFVIVIIGYISILAGGGAWRVHLGLGVRRELARALDAGPRCSMMLMSSRSLLVGLAACCLLLQLALLAVYFGENGFGFDLRAYTFAHPGVRPISQITSLTSVWIGSHCLARYVDTKERSLLACTLLLSFGLLFFGQRSSIFLVYMNVAIGYLVKLGSRVSLLRIIGVVAAMLAFGLYLGNAREGIYSLGEFFGTLVFLILYGNNFTDFRDFAWMYADWNHQFWIGKTYLAGLATFMPRGISAFRATWSFGIASGWTVGLDTETHPGLKPGLFGEAFFNFGLLGVVIAGFLLGVLLRRVDIDVKAFMGSTRPSMRKAFASTMLLNVAGCITGSLAVPFLYDLLGIYLFAWFYLHARLLVLPQRIETA